MMAFRRALALGARYDVNPHLVKLWKVHKPTQGQVTRSLSPFEQNIITPFVKAYPAELLKNVKEACVDILPAFVALYVVVVGGTEYFHKLQHDHRD